MGVGREAYCIELAPCMDVAWMRSDMIASSSNVSEYHSSNSEISFYF